MRYALLFTMWLALACQPAAKLPVHTALSDSLRQALGPGLLDIWYPRCVDSLYGGYLTQFDSAWRPEGSQAKMLVTQARHVWTTAQAAAFYPEKKASYLAMSAHGARFLQEAMWDSVYGGFYQMVDREGRPMATGYGTQKRAYGQAFAIYGLAAYAGESGDVLALSRAGETFRWLERHAYDPEHGGYFEHLDRQGRPLARGSATTSWDSLGFGYKDYNSSIHLLEAFTELYRHWPDSLLRVRLAELHVLIRDRMADPRGFLRLYFTPDWQVVSWADSSREALEASHYAMDHVTPGHDMETAFLLLESQAVLTPGTEDAATTTLTRRLMDHSLAYGFDRARGGLYERLFYFPGADTPTVVLPTKTWWAQAEGLHSLCLFASRYPEEPAFQQAFLQQWAYIQRYVLDPVHGGWYPAGLDMEPAARGRAKAQAWKGAYHTARSLMGVIHLLED